MDHYRCVGIWRRGGVLTWTRAQDAQLQRRETVDLRRPVLPFQVVEDRKDFPRVEVHVGGHEPIDRHGDGWVRNIRHCQHNMTHPPFLP